jgi:hypothetical protein
MFLEVFRTVSKEDIESETNNPKRRVLFKKKRTCCAPSVCAWEAAEAKYGCSSSSYEDSHELCSVGEADRDGSKSFYVSEMIARLSIVTAE